MRKILAMAAAALSVSVSSADPGSLNELVKSFKTSDHPCVGYKASKQVPLSGRTEVIGINCASVDIELKNKNEIRMTVSPAFESGNGRRDRHVVGALGGKQKTPVVVSMSLDGLGALPKADVTLNGTISVLGNETPVQAFVSKLIDNSYGVLIQTSFSDLKLEKPRIGPFGFGGSVNEDLTLFGRISADRAATLIQSK